MGWVERQLSSIPSRGPAHSGCCTAFLVIRHKLQQQHDRPPAHLPPTFLRDNRGNVLSICIKKNLAPGVHLEQPTPRYYSMRSAHHLLARGLRFCSFTAQVILFFSHATRRRNRRRKRGPRRRDRVPRRKPREGGPTVATTTTTIQHIQTCCSDCLYE